MKFSSFLFLSFITTISFSNEIQEEQKQKKQKKELLSLEFIKQQEKGFKTDFLINEFLKQDSTTSEQAYETLQYINSMDTKLFTNFALKYGHDETLAVVQCQNMPLEQLVNSYTDCIKLGLSFKEASELSPLKLKEIIKKTKSKYPQFAKKLNVIASSIPFTKIITLDTKEFYDLYFNLPMSFKERYLNYKLPRKTFFRLFEDKINFEKYLKQNITNRSFDIVNESFLGINDQELSYEASFLLGLNAFLLEDKLKANIFLLNSLIKVDEKDLNKILFWLYKISNNDTYLKDIIYNTKSIDKYTKLSHEVLQQKSAQEKLIEKPNTKDSLLHYFDYLNGKITFENLNL